MFSFGSSKSAIGLDVGTYSVKMVHMKKGSAEPQILSFGIAHFPHEGAVASDGQIVDPNAVSEVIKELFKSSKVKPTNVVTCLSNQNIISRFIKVPMMADNELEEAVKYEAEQYVPYALDEMNLSFYKLSQVEEDGIAQHFILLVCAQKDILKNFLNTLKNAAVTPQVVDVDNLAIINSLEKAIRPDEVTAIIDIGASSTNINIIKEGVLKFTRNILIAGNNITNAIMNVLKLDFAQAENIKTEEVVVSTSEDSEDNDVSEVVRSIIEELASEIRRSFDYYKAQHREHTINRILLSGGTAKLKNLDVFLANELGVEVEKANPLEGIVANVANVDQLNEHLLELTAAIGLALREVM
ncbi:MAG TPA: type IV pilus assembly protein PilM [Candidatus Wallbacteria bacterium]|nr:MAG: Competence protein A [bacterium ADurb.Bin243]HOD39403.1 type IV pilus assembly protein PilM [Candidatus Wallbacteria bacterium]HOT75158.1 type IV pilus assembly protein PilM [Candidatus Wallbacteria bacterium]HPG57533.1 type IV pilus assembly protein PilM [Candidatus Wallbacteria bacterium]